MKNIMFITLLMFYFLLWSSDVHAGGAVAKRQEAQQKIMQQRQQQAQAQRTMMEQRMQFEQSQKNAMQQKAIQQQQESIMGKQKQEQQLREQSYQERAEKERQLAAEVKDVVDVNDLMKSFESSSRAWPLIIDQEAKVVVVSAYIDQYRREGVGINKSSVYYAELIDAMAQQTPDIFNQPFKNVLRVLAVIEYDFENGQSKDEMALKVLGNRQAVLQNRQRLGL